MKNLGIVFGVALVGKTLLSPLNAEENNVIKKDPSYVIKEVPYFEKSNDGKTDMVCFDRQVEFTDGTKLGIHSIKFCRTISDVMKQNQKLSEDDMKRKIQEIDSCIPRGMILEVNPNTTNIDDWEFIKSMLGKISIKVSERVKLCLNEYNT